jgi:hypothetical protein
LIDPDETWLEKWLLHEMNEVWNYYSCVSFETNPRIKAVWERFLDYELGHVQHVMQLMKEIERRDPEELMPRELPEPIQYRSQREFVRETLREVPFRAVGSEIGELPDSEATLAYRDHMNSEGSPSDTITAGYGWHPGGELAAEGRKAKEGSK